MSCHNVTSAALRLQQSKKQSNEIEWEKLASNKIIWNLSSYKIAQFLMKK